MELTRKQQEALKITIDRYRAGEKYTVISGYAGAGKSTVVKYIISALCNDADLEPAEDVAYCAFTGKAASILGQKGCPNAITAHKLLYDARPMPNGTFKFFPKGEIEYSIVVVDECSMLPKTMVDQLLKYSYTYIIFCGDPGQLPPINKDQDNHLLDHPHVFLDEIMRQAADSGIIQLSMKIRNGEPIDGFKSDDALVIPKRELVDGMLTWSDIVLSATNATRIALNTQIRSMYNFNAPIVENEKIICLNNYWDIASDKGNALTNGCIGYLTNFFESKQVYPDYLGGLIITCNGNLNSEYGDKFDSLSIDKEGIITGKPSLDGKTKYKIGRIKKYKDTIPLEFTYGYVITGHKAQGSQWNKVLVIEENFPFDREEHARWLYTACTRSASRLVLVR